MTATETCRCGATFSMSGPQVAVALGVSQFRRDHASCRKPDAHGEELGRA